VEGSGSSLIDLPFWHSTEETEELHQNPSQDSQDGVVRKITRESQ
jgi:hypothetical protein